MYRQVIRPGPPQAETHDHQLIPPQRDPARLRGKAPLEQHSALGRMGIEPMTIGLKGCCSTH